MLREGIRTVLEEYTDIEVVGEATDGEQALILAKFLNPDVVIMDVNMPRVDGIEATRQLKKEMPGTIVIGLSVDNSKQVEGAMRRRGCCRLLDQRCRHRATSRDHYAGSSIHVNRGSRR